MPRFHLSFDYQRLEHSSRSSGDHVVIADNLDEAVLRIARDRGLKSIHIRKRFFSGKPAGDAEIINRDFQFPGAV